MIIIIGVNRWSSNLMDDFFIDAYVFRISTFSQELRITLNREKIHWTEHITLSIYGNYISLLYIL